MQDQIAAFTSSLSNLASEYSNPAIILDHLPIVKDHMDKIDPALALVSQNKEIAIGGAIGLLVLLSMRKRRRKAARKPTSMVMPKPYRGEDSTLPDDHPLNAETPNQIAENKLRLRLPKKVKDAEDHIERTAAQAVPREIPEPPQSKLLTGEEELAHVAQVQFQARPILSPDEARMRVIVQSALAQRKAPLLLMARVALDAALTPSQDAVGPSRANAIAALKGRHIDLALFDRAGRIVAALAVPKTLPVGAAANDAKIVQQSLAHAGIPLINLTAKDGPEQVGAKIAPFVNGTPMQHAEGTHQSAAREPALVLGTTQRVESSPKRAARPTRPVRPAKTERPTRPVSPSSIAAE